MKSQKTLTDFEIFSNIFREFSKYPKVLRNSVSTWHFKSINIINNQLLTSLMHISNCTHFIYFPFLRFELKNFIFFPFIFAVHKTDGTKTKTINNLYTIPTLKLLFILL